MVLSATRNHIWKVNDGLEGREGIGGKVMQDKLKGRKDLPYGDCEERGLTGNLD